RDWSSDVCSSDLNLSFFVLIFTTYPNITIMSIFHFRVFLPFEKFRYYFFYYNIFVRKCIYISANVHKIIVNYYERSKQKNLKEIISFVKVYFYGLNDTTSKT